MQTSDEASTAALGELVAEGTLDEQQAARVAEVLAASRPAARPDEATGTRGRLAEVAGYLGSALLLGAGAAGVSVDLDVLPVAAYDALADLLEQGRPVHLGVVPSIPPAAPPSDRAVTERVLRLLDMLGLDQETASSLVLTPACGLARADAGWARQALTLVRKAASSLRG